MPPFELVLPFLLATSIFAFIPGPGMFFMAVQTMAHGANAGWLSACAFHLVSYGHIACAAFGVTILVAAAPVLLTALKLAGAAYLVWIGVKLLISKRRSVSHGNKTQPATQAFKDSVVVELLNPKSILFYFAFLPQFTSLESAAPLWLQIICLGVIANVLFSLSDLVCIAAARFVAKRASPSRIANRWARRIGGGVLMGMGVKLATATAEPS